MLRTLGGATTLDTGAGDDVVRVGSLTQTLNGIASTLSITGGGDRDELYLDDSGDTAANTGRLTSTTVTGLGLGGTLTYLGFEAFELLLGSGADTLFVDSTHAGTTRIDLGAGADRLDLETIAGLTRIEGGAGADTLNINPVLDAANGLAAILTLDGEGDGDTYNLNLWGIGGSIVRVARQRHRPARTR